MVLNRGDQGVRACLQLRHIAGQQGIAEQETADADRDGSQTQVRGGCFQGYPASRHHRDVRHGHEQFPQVVQPAHRTNGRHLDRWHAAVPSRDDLGRCQRSRDVAQSAFGGSVHQLRKEDLADGEVGAGGEYEVQARRRDSEVPVGCRGRQAFRWRRAMDRVDGEYIMI